MVPSTSPVIVASMFGNSTKCVERAKSILEQAGYEVLVFHATGNGGQAMESLIDDGLIAGVLDITTTELADEQVGGFLTAGPDRELENRELKAVLQEAVEVLPDPLRTVFCLREIEGLSTEETSGALGLTVENVRVRLHRAKRSLREMLDQRIGREVRRLYLFDGARCDRVVEGVFSRLLLDGTTSSDSRS